MTFEPRNKLLDIFTCEMETGYNAWILTSNPTTHNTILRTPLYLSLYVIKTHLQVLFHRLCTAAMQFRYFTCFVSGKDFKTPRALKAIPVFLTCDALTCSLGFFPLQKTVHSSFLDVSVPGRCGSIVWVCLTHMYKYVEISENVCMHIYVCLHVISVN